VGPKEAKETSLMLEIDLPETNKTGITLIMSRVDQKVPPDAKLETERTCIIARPVEGCQIRGNTLFYSYDQLFPGALYSVSVRTFFSIAGRNQTYRAEPYVRSFSTSLDKANFRSYKIVDSNRLKVNFFLPRAEMVNITFQLFEKYPKMKDFLLSPYTKISYYKNETGVLYDHIIFPNPIRSTAGYEYKVQVLINKENSNPNTNPNPVSYFFDETYKVKFPGREFYSNLSSA
jgi:hypothetical protein